MDIEEYADYAKEHLPYVEMVVNLDSIPGEWGRQPSHVEVEESAKKSWESAKYLESKGLTVMPVFHQGESFKWLVRMVEEGYWWIGISPDNNKTTKQKQDWLDQVFTIITDKDGWPVIGTHGFGVTSADLMIRYPWKSCDSATWIRLGAFGGTMVPKWRDGEWLYDRSPYIIFTSSKATTTLTSGQHFKNFGPGMQAHIVKFFESEGYTLKDLEDTFEARSFVTLRVLERVRANLTDVRFRYPVNDVFLRRLRVKKPGKSMGNMRLFEALSGASIYSDMLTVEGVKDRLFTYNILKNQDPGFLQFYVKHGVFPIGKCYKRLLTAGDIGDEKPVEPFEVDLSKVKRKEHKPRNHPGMKKRAAQLAEAKAKRKLFDGQIAKGS